MHHIGRRLLIVAALIVTGSACSVGSIDASSEGSTKSAEPAVQPGKWKAERTVVAAGDAPRTDTITWCMTSDHAADLPMAMVRAGACKKTSEARKGRVIEWTIECQMPKGAARTVSKGEIEAGGDHAKLTMETTTFIGADARTQKTTWDGKRIGPCD